MRRGKLPWAIAPVVGHTEIVERLRDKGRPTRADGGPVAVAAGGALVARLIWTGACVFDGAGDVNLNMGAGEGGVCAGGGEACSEEPMMREGGEKLSAIQVPIHTFQDIQKTYRNVRRIIPLLNNP